MTALPATRPADLSLSYGRGGGLGRRVALTISGERGQLLVTEQGGATSEESFSVTPAEFDALYAAIVAADLPRLLRSLQGPHENDYDGPGFELTWASERFSIVESGFRYRDARFDALAAHFDEWLRS